VPRPARAAQRAAGAAGAIIGFDLVGGRDQIRPGVASPGWPAHSNRRSKRRRPRPPTAWRTLVHCG
jgi:hypothetical protein